MAAMQTGTTKQGGTCGKSHYQLGRVCIRRVGWKDCVELVTKYRWKVVPRKDGSAELWDPDDYCEGFLTAKSVELFNRVVKPSSLKSRAPQPTAWR